MPNTNTVLYKTNNEVRTIVVEPVSKVKRPGTVRKEKVEKPILPDRLVIRQYGLDGSFVGQFETYDEAEEKNRNC